MNCCTAKSPKSSSGVTSIGGNSNLICTIILLLIQIYSNEFENTVDTINNSK